MAISVETDKAYDQQPTPPEVEVMVLSPDNRRAYFIQVDQESDIWMIEIGQQ